ncbi:hypothetical protein K491DRAFT_694719 [Lophiostoma macrostomum CBS 122681]|uniref:Uncharacterized protein n=1 Tax=Lophiostoma macrostomum CBS 122681 TaxID=1314788 RepID=A0A6A6T076_9PLEO|nr:hypothetical protein K491DRAFT_694719 [Lophiostoma macrostomum CBS 122681]
MCLVTTKPSRRSLDNPPRHSSRYSAHPPAGVVRLPRNSTHSYRESREYVRDDYRRSEPRVVEYRRSSRPEIEYHEPGRTTRRSVSVVRERDVGRASRGSFVDERRASSVRFRD